MRKLSGVVLLAGCTMLALAPVSTSAQAQEMIQRKPGLWRITMNFAGAPAGMPAMSMCIDSKTDASMQQMAQNGAMPDCSRKDIKRVGNQMIIDSVCKIGNSTSTSHGVMTFTGDTAYHMDMTTTFNPPMGGQAEHKMSQDAAWTGPCPAGVAPGDMVMPNGMKMNMGSMSGMTGRPPGKP
jgi:hypothetical protein